jgi:hypothetical protein
MIIIMLAQVIPISELPVLLAQRLNQHINIFLSGINHIDSSLCLLLFPRATEGLAMKKLEVLIFLHYERDGYLKLPSIPCHSFLKYFCFLTGQKLL